MQTEVNGAAIKVSQRQEIPGPFLGTSTTTKITEREATRSSITIKPTTEHRLPPPPEGIVDAVCVRIEDKGVVHTDWGDRHKISIIWEIDALKQDGTRFEVAKWYTSSLFIKSNLRKDLASWRGRDLTPEEEQQQFNTDILIGMPCRLELIHVPGKEGDVYARVQSVLPPTEQSQFGVKEFSE